MVQCIWSVSSYTCTGYGAWVTPGHTHSVSDHMLWSITFWALSNWYSDIDYWILELVFWGLSVVLTTNILHLYGGQASSGYWVDVWPSRLDFQAQYLNIGLNNLKIKLLFVSRVWSPSHAMSHIQFWITVRIMLKPVTIRSSSPFTLWIFKSSIPEPPI